MSEQAVTHYVLDLEPAGHWPRTPCGLSTRFQVLMHAETPTCPACAAWLADPKKLITEREPEPVSEGPCETCAESTSDQCATCGFDRPLCICQPKAEPVSEMDQVRR